jgi:hypothetical protein
MWETWQRDDDDVVRAAISASKVLDLWPIPEEAREETLLRLTEAIFDMITERILDQLQARDRQMLESARNGTAHIESGDGRRIDRDPTSRPEEPPWLAGQRDQALRAIDQCHRDQPLMLDKSAHILENLIKYADPTCLTARYLVAVGDPHYNSAFGKMLALPQDAHLRFSAAETEAVRAVSKVMEERALAEGTGSAGGFAIPITIDPSVTLTGSGALNPA